VAFDEVGISATAQIRFLKPKKQKKEKKSAMARQVYGFYGGFMTMTTALFVFYSNCVASPS